MSYWQVPYDLDLDFMLHWLMLSLCLTVGHVHHTMIPCTKYRCIIAYSFDEIDQTTKTLTNKPWKWGHSQMKLVRLTCTLTIISLIISENRSYHKILLTLTNESWKWGHGHMDLTRETCVPYNHSNQQR